jgi:hypothetical protein
VIDFFPFGSFFKSQIKGSDKLNLIHIKIDSEASYLKKIISTIKKIGELSNGNLTVFVGSHRFVAFGYKENEEQLFWNFQDSFVIEIIRWKEVIEQKPDSKVQKLYLILNDGKPYCYHFQKKIILQKSNMSQKEKRYIKFFEEGLAILYDYK